MGAVAFPRSLRLSRAVRPGDEDRGEQEMGKRAHSPCSYRSCPPRVPRETSEGRL